MNTTRHITAASLIVLASALPAFASPASVAADQQRSPDMRWSIDTIYLELLVDNRVIGKDDAFAATEAAAQAWNETGSGPQLVVVEAKQGVVGDRTRLDRHNVIHFTTSDWQGDPRAAAETIRMGRSGSGVISEVDVDVNAASFTFCQCQRDGALDLQSILTHELGHVLGLRDDFMHEDATMFIASTEANLTKRTLSSYDLSALSELYRGVSLRAESGCSSTGASGPCAGLALLVPLAFASRRRRRRRAKTCRRQAAPIAVGAVALMSAIGCAVPASLPADIVIPVGTVDLDTARERFEATACARSEGTGPDNACAALVALDRSDDGEVSAPPALPPRLPLSVEIGTRRLDVPQLLARAAVLRLPSLALDPRALTGADREQLDVGPNDVEILDAYLSFDEDTLTVDLPAMEVTIDGAQIGVFAPHVGGSFDAAPLSLADGGADALVAAVLAGKPITISPRTPDVALQHDEAAVSRPGGTAVVSLALALQATVTTAFHANVTIE